MRADSLLALNGPCGPPVVFGSAFRSREAAASKGRPGVAVDRADCWTTLLRRSTDCPTEMDGSRRAEYRTSAGFSKRGKLRPTLASRALGRTTRGRGSARRGAPPLARGARRARNGVNAWPGRRRVGAGEAHARSADRRPRGSRSGGRPQEAAALQLPVRGPRLRAISAAGGFRRSGTRRPPRAE